MAKSQKPNSHILMFPWFATGHMTPFLHLSNDLASRGQKITFLAPKKAIIQLQPLNLHQDLIFFQTLTIPHVNGLPEGTETASEIPLSLNYILTIAMDKTRDQVQKFILSTKPNFVFFDFAHWVPEITKPLGIKSVCFSVVSAASLAIGLVPARNVCKDKPITVEELKIPPSGYPSKTIVLHEHEVHSLCFISMPFGDGITFYERLTTAMKESDIFCIRTAKEIEGELCDYMSDQYKKPLLLTGPVLPEPTKNTQLEDRWDKWLKKFEAGKVVFCAFGSQFILEKDQFQQLVLGFELTGLPFFIALKPPMGCSTIEEALPEGFEERVKERGVVYGGWVQQPLILDHPSVGCFVNHCGFGSMWESLMSDCQIVLVPQLGDQILNTRLLTKELKVAVEVKREENGWFTKESLSEAIMSVMDSENEVCEMVRKNHIKWREVLGKEGFMSGYVDKFLEDLLSQ